MKKILTIIFILFLGLMCTPSFSYQPSPGEYEDFNNYFGGMSQESVDEYFYGENDNEKLYEFEEFEDYNPPLYGFEYDKTPDKDLFSPTDSATDLLNKNNKEFNLGRPLESNRNLDLNEQINAEIERVQEMFRELRDIYK